MTITARMIILNNELDANKLTEANVGIDAVEMYLIMTGSSLSR
jgi:hypothetical protein